MTPSCDSVATTVFLLGGPVISPSELEWATEFESGKKVVDWIASQADTLLQQSDESPGDDPDNELMRKVALMRISLESEEDKTCSRSPHVEIHSDSNRTGLDAKETDVSPVNYISPDRQRCHTIFLDKQGSLVEKEVQILEARLKQAKSAFQKISLSVPQIKNELKVLNRDINERQDLLSDLTIKADTNIARLCQQASLHLDHVNTKDAIGVQAVLKDCTDLHSQVLHHAESLIEEIQEIRDRIPSSAEVHAEAVRLNAAFDISSDKEHSLPFLAQEVAFCHQLNQLADIISQSSGDDGEIYDILQQFASVSDSDLSNEAGLVVDVQQELENAWNKDQKSSLTAYEHVLDITIAAMDSAVLPPLRNIHAVLSANQIDVQAVADIVGVIGKEMDEIVNDLEIQKQFNSDPPLPNQYSTEESQVIMNLLKRLKDSRTSDSSPLLLLDEADILNEVTATLKRKLSLDCQENQLEDSIPLSLNRLHSTHDAALMATYANSPVNTSLPYSLSASALALINDAKVKSDHLVEIIQRLQQNMTSLQSSRTQRKIQSFVDRWNVVPA